MDLGSNDEGTGHPTNRYGSEGDALKSQPNMGWAVKVRGL